MKHEMSDNHINMCFISLPALVLRWRKRHVFVWGFLVYRKWLQQDSEGHSSAGKGESWGMYPFLIKACWWITWRKVNGDHTNSCWQEANFDVPFLSLRCFSFKPKSAWTAWENVLLPTFMLSQLTTNLNGIQITDKLVFYFHAVFCLYCHKQIAKKSIFLSWNLRNKTWTWVGEKGHQGAESMPLSFIPDCLIQKCWPMWETLYLSSIRVHIQSN